MSHPVGKLLRIINPKSLAWLKWDKEHLLPQAGRAPPRLRLPGLLRGWGPDMSKGLHRPPGWPSSCGNNMERNARLKRFIESARGLAHHCECSGDDLRVVVLSDVRNLLVNLHEGKEPDHRPPPIWACQDRVGALKRRGWRITDDHAGMHRRGFFIPAESFDNPYQRGGVESTADVLESEYAQRTDRCGETGLPPAEKAKLCHGCDLFLTPTVARCPHDYCKSCCLAGLCRKCNVNAAMAHPPNIRSPDPEPPKDEDCPHCVNNSGCNHCNPSGLPRD